ncbi:unnamed protein product [Cladocopium goreaui]|uniref:C2H2-type domain-containing protein n=1 Tax=Cladocopium goreaui TaxID=2562237 RepID=A0A9P1DQR2_9DINO|nr:unnamed protein product [Cladocopium goreaui]
MKAQEVHINMVRQYRCAQTRMNHMSEDATKPGRKDNFDEFIKIEIDACDEAKFKCPRNIANAKNLERLWRPQLHLHGSLIWGVAECYYVMEPDIPKDASTEATILCKALDDAADLLRQRSTSMPGNLILEA